MTVEAVAMDDGELNRLSSSANLVSLSTRLNMSSL